MPTPLPRLDPEQRRRRLRVLAECADASARCIRMRPERVRLEKIRVLVATRRRLAG